MPPSGAVSKPQRMRLTISQKIQIAEEIQSGVSFASLQRTYKVGPRTLSRIKKEASNLKKQAHAVGLTLDAKAIRPTTFPLIEERVMQFVCLSRCVNMPVTLAVISQRALMIRDELLNMEGDTYNRETLRKFTASKGWAHKFVKRHSLRSVAIHGQGAIAPEKSVAEDIASLRERLKEYSVDCIYTVDEVALFFKLLPRRTYVVEEEDKSTVRGIKAMSAEDRVTAYVCTNADGSAKLPMAIIGKSKNPRSFRLGQPEVPYFSQTNAWSDTLTFKRWFHGVFVPFVRKRTSAPVALLMDNCGRHAADLIDHKNQVSIFPLPPNCTASHQPMDLGIISAWKAHYRRLMLRDVMDDLETRMERRQHNWGLAPGMTGLAEGYDPHMLDVTHLVRVSWEKVQPMTIAQCWVKSKVLPQSHSAELNSIHGKMQNTFEEAIVEDIVSSLSSLSLKESKDIPLLQLEPLQITCSSITEWINVESNEEVRDALINDAIEEDTVRVNYVTRPAYSLHDDGETVTSRDVPSWGDLDLRFRDLQELTFGCNVPLASSFLRKAKDALNGARRERGKGRSR